MYFFGSETFIILLIKDEHKALTIYKAYITITHCYEITKKITVNPCTSAPSKLDLRHE
jgi:hypothetical protein